MGNPVYESVLARLVQVTPLLARGLLDAGMYRYGFEADTITAIQMNRLVDEFLSRELSDVDLEGIGQGMVVADEQLLFVSDTLQDMFFEDSNLPLGEQLTHLEMLGVLLPSGHDLYHYDAIRLYLSSPYKSTLMVGRCVLPGGHGGTLRMAFVKDETLQNILRGEVSQVQSDLDEAVRAREELSRNLLRKERAVSSSLKQALEAKDRELLQSEKLASMGSLLGGIAHELNNLLGPILGYSQLMKGWELDERSTDAVDRIELAAQSAAAVVRTMLNFANPRVGGDARGDVNQAVRDVCKLMAKMWEARGIELQLMLNDRIPPVVADAGQIRSIVLNLVVNATQVLDTQTAEGEESAPAPSPWIFISSEYDDSQVTLNVRDNGGGVNEALRERLFEPYVTGRSDSDGLGLGLSIARGIASSVGGTLAVENVGEGHDLGALFSVHLPVVPTSLDDLEISSDSLVRDGETASCLIVDDEEALLAMMRDVMVEAGYWVEAVTSGSEALQLLRSNKYDLIISDIRMPEIDGFQVIEHERMREGGGQAKFLLVTGDLLDDQLRQRIQELGANVLYKPFDIRVLLDTVARALRH